MINKRADKIWNLMLKLNLWAINYFRPLELPGKEINILKA
jgi:hypothetical protein